MLEKWLVGVVIAFVLRQLAKFKDTVDWVKVKADLDLRVRALVPGTWFDDEAAAIVGLVMDRVIAVLSQGDQVKVILELLAAEQWAAALVALKDLLLGGWVPEGAAMKKGANGSYATGDSPGAKAYAAVAAV